MTAFASIIYDLCTWVNLHVYMGVILIAPINLSLPKLCKRKIPLITENKNS